jgi:hypothetical protein
LNKYQAKEVVITSEEEEALGHLASALTKYRAFSRTWHSFLGFNVYISANRSTNGYLEASTGESELCNKMMCLCNKDIGAEIQQRVDEERNFLK